MSPPSPGHRAQRRLLRAGDHDAFARLFADHADVVFGLALRMTGSRSSAEDVTSETFLVVWRRREDIAVDDEPLRGWLLAIAAHQSMNVTRGVRRRLAYLVSARGHDDVVPDFSDETAKRLDDVERLDRTRTAMSQLSRPEVEVLSLCLWSDLTYAEAAVALGVPVGTVRSRLHRARERLRRLTDDDADHARPSLIEGPSR